MGYVYGGIQRPTRKIENIEKKHKRMTAVELLYNQLEFDDTISIYDIENIFDQAKEMEKAEKHAEYMRGWKDGYSKNEPKEK